MAAAVLALRRLRRLGLAPASQRRRLGSTTAQEAPLPMRCAVAIVGGGPVGTFTSLLLSKFGVPSLLLEAGARGGGDSAAADLAHPRAHVLHARAMELLRQVGLEGEISAMVPPSEHWRRFRYCVELLGTDFSVADHFRTPEYRMQARVSPCRVSQLSQPRLERVLTSEARRLARSCAGGGAQIVCGAQVEAIERHGGGAALTVRREDGTRAQVLADFVVAADGGHSRVREAVGVPLEGERDMETFASIHFSSVELGRRLEAREGGAMLSFVFNEKVMGVVVSHDMRRGEWVVHVPFFPPLQTIDQLQDPQVVRTVVGDLVGGDMPDLEVHSTRAWGMHGVCAQAFSAWDDTVFLAGDAAHQFPPSGGFGVNAGLMDAHNLAWKLAYVVQGRSPRSLLSSYDQERRLAVQDQLGTAVDNYRRGLLPARALGLDRAAMTSAVSLLGNAAAGTADGVSAARQVLDGLLWAGKQHLRRGAALLGPRVDELVNQRREALPLLFPRTDKGFIYTASTALAGAADPPPAARREAFWRRPPFSRHAQTDWDPDNLRAGALLPHHWLRRAGSGAALSTLDLVAESAPRCTLLCSDAALWPLVESLAAEDPWLAANARAVPLGFGGELDFVGAARPAWLAAGVLLVRPDGHVAWLGSGGADGPGGREALRESLCFMAPKAA